MGTIRNVVVTLRSTLITLLVERLVVLVAYWLVVFWSRDYLITFRRQDCV